MKEREKILRNKHGLRKKPQARRQSSPCMSKECRVLNKFDNIPNMSIHIIKSKTTYVENLRLYGKIEGRYNYTHSCN